MHSESLKTIVATELERLSEGAPVAAKVARGVVTLTGVVQNEMRRTFIEQELLRLPGILGVRNHLHVAFPVGGVPTQLLERLDREDVRTDGMTIEESDGRVVLTGRAACRFDKDAAERLAWTLPNVREVENHLTLPGRRFTRQP